MASLETVIKNEAWDTPEQVLKAFEWFIRDQYAGDDEFVAGPPITIKIEVTGVDESMRS